MKKKEVVDLITSLSSLIISFTILLFPIFKINDLKLVLTIIFGFYTIIKLTGFIIIFKEKDVENLFTSIISLLMLISLYIGSLTTKKLVLIILIWLGLISLVKLKKADFYHDRQNKMWILRLFILFIFIITGLLTSLNLMYESQVQILIITYFFIINNLLDTIDPLTSYLMRGHK